ncbi:hypothetical protein T492DRAFT_884792 [Pavlovales sp. CCMP2436]|nr:hypothetical protein T492DRAFT_884792 [Pavlovales sp. CCMP2436]
MAARRCACALALYSQPGSSHGNSRSPLCVRLCLAKSEPPSSSLAPPTSVQYSETPSACAHPRRGHACVPPLRARFAMAELGYGTLGPSMTPRELTAS